LHDGSPPEYFLLRYSKLFRSSAQVQISYNHNMWIEGFLVGFSVGVVGMVAIFVALRTRRGDCKTSTKTSDNNPPHTDTASAAKIGHDRGIEVFDD
jgi:hypothetical protein